MVGGRDRIRAAVLASFDFYNFWPALLITAAWVQELSRQAPQLWPIGFKTWRTWANSVGRTLAIAERGLMSKTMVNGGRPEHEGWDNPVFITKFLDFCQTNVADIAHVSYFNSDNTPSEQLPAHLIKTWPGIDGTTARARTPPGAATGAVRVPSSSGRPPAADSGSPSRDDLPNPIAPETAQQNLTVNK